MAGSCFIVPVVLIVIFIAGLYVRCGRLPALIGALYGVKSVKSIQQYSLLKGRQPYIIPLCSDNGSNLND